MDTLLKTSSKSKWTPAFVDDIRKSFIINMKFSIEKNIAYNLQYLQFISKQLKELRLTSVLEKMLYKTYIITGMSILEAVFYCVLKEKNLLPKEYWKTQKQYISNEVGPEDKRTRVLSEFQIKQDPEIVPQNLDSLIKKIKSKQIISAKSLTYDILEIFRKLRNKVHIYICDDSSESDYNSFTYRDYITMKFLLKKILYDDVITNKNKREPLDIIFKNADEEFSEEIKKTKK